MGSKSKESVYVSVETLGVQQSAESIKSISNPLSDVTKTIAQLEKSQMSVVKSSNSLTTKIKSNLSIQNTSIASLSKSAGSAKQSIQSLSMASSKSIDILSKFAQAAGGGSLSQGLGQAKNLTEGLAAATGGLSTTMLATGAVLGATALAIYEISKAGKACLDEFDKLHPEVETVNDVFDETKSESEDLSNALMAMAGESINDALLPGIKDLADAFLSAKESASKFLAQILTIDDKTKESGFATMIQGTLGQMKVSAKKALGMDTTADEAALDDLANQNYRIKQKSDAKFEENKALSKKSRSSTSSSGSASSSVKDNIMDVGDLFNEVIMTEDGLIAKTKDYHDQVINDINNELIAKLTSLELANVDEQFKREQRSLAETEAEKKLKDEKIRYAKETGDYITLYEDQQADARQSKESESQQSSLITYQEYLKQREALINASNQAVSLYEDSLKSAGITDEQMQSEMLNAYKLQKQQELYTQLQAAGTNYRAQEQNAELSAYSLVMDQKWQMEQNLLNKKKSAENEWRAAEQEYLNSTLSNSLQSIGSGFVDMFEQGVEGTLDMRQSSYDMFKSLAKNIFSSSISQIVSSMVGWATNAGESQAGIPIVGPVLAAAASGAVLAMMGIMKAKAGKEAKIKYSTGGYVSSGFVKGAYSSGDSVSAYLQPGERVLSKEETKAYDENMGKSSNITVNVTINGQLSTQSQIDTTVREALIPSIRRAVQQGYSLGV